MRSRTLAVPLAVAFAIPSSRALAQGGPEAAGPETAAPAAELPAPRPPLEETAPRRRTAADESVAARTAAPGAATGISNDGILPSLVGPVGLYRLTTADVGPKGGFRFGLHGEYFTAKSFLIKQDDDTHLGGNFAFAYTPSEYVELFMGVFSASNENKRNILNETNRRDPQVIKSFGDFAVGPKVRIPLSPGVDLGLELGLKFLSSISSLALSTSSTSVWFGPLMTLDLRRMNETPLRFHINTSYYVDNSEELNPYTQGVYSLFTKEVSSFAYGIGKSRFRLGLGMDAPLERQMPQLPLQPFAELHYEIVTGSADKCKPGDVNCVDFTDFMKPKCSDNPAPGSGQQKCKENKDQAWATFGLRARVWKALTLDVGLDVSMRSVGFPYGPPLPPWQLLFGFAVPLDIEGLTRTQIVTKLVEKPVQVGKPAVDGHVRGVVTSTKANAPIAGAMVAVAGRTQSRAATDPDGTFRTIGLPPGPADLEVSAQGFDPATVKATVVVGKPTEVTVALTPRALTGNVRGRVADDKGAGIEASVKFMGPDNFEAHADGSGAFSAALPVGMYQVRAEAANFLTKESLVEVAQGQERSTEFTLRTRPAVPAAGVSGTGITLKGFKFRTPTDTLAPMSMHLLDEVVDALVNHPELKRIRVEAHWDASLPKAKADDLTKRQAEAVRAYLVKQGINEARVEAVGMGSLKPLVPNIGAANKGKNRRVEFVAGL